MAVGIDVSPGKVDLLMSFTLGAVSIVLLDDSKSRHSPGQLVRRL